MYAIRSYYAFKRGGGEGFAAAPQNLPPITHTNVVIASGTQWSEAICCQLCRPIPKPSLRSGSCRRSNLYPDVASYQTGLPLSCTDCRPSKPDKLSCLLPRNDGACQLRPIHQSTIINHQSKGFRPPTRQRTFMLSHSSLIIHPSSIESPDWQGTDCIFAPARSQVSFSGWFMP